MLTKRGANGRSAKGACSTKQVGAERRGGEGEGQGEKMGREGGALGQVLYWGSGWSTHVKGITGFLDVSDVTRSRSGQNGLFVAGASQPYHTAAPGHLGGVLTAYLQGC